MLPSLKVTVPVGAPPVLGLTPAIVAVSVMLPPWATGLAELLNVVLLFAWLTVSVTAADVALGNVVLPR